MVDECGGHFGFTNDTAQTGTPVYHYHTKARANAFFSLSLHERHGTDRHPRVPLPHKGTFFFHFGFTNDTAQTGTPVYHYHTKAPFFFFDVAVEFNRFNRSG